MSAASATYPIGVIAKLLMLTERHVQRLAADGIIPKGERGRYELAPAVQGYVRYLKERAIGGDVSASDDGRADKLRLQKARADIAEMEAERLAETLVPADEVQTAWLAITARFKQRVLAASTKAAPLTAVETETDACHQIIETFIREALAELAATEIEGEPAPVDSAVDDGGVPLGVAAAQFDGERVGGSSKEVEPRG